MDMTLTLTTDNFKETIEADGIVLIDFWASWCGPCRMFAPVFEKAAQQNPDITFGKVDTEDQPALAGAFQIMSIPTLMVFRDRVLLYSQPGALSTAALDNLIDQVRAIDMDEVHKELAAQSVRQ